MYLLATCTSHFDTRHLSSSTHSQSSLFHVQFLRHSGYQPLSVTQFSNTFSFLENFLFLMPISLLWKWCHPEWELVMFAFVLCFWNAIKKKKSSHFSILKDFHVFPNFRPCVSRCCLNEGREGSTMTPLQWHLVLTAPFTEDFPFPSTHSQQPWGRAAGCGHVGF